MKSEPTLSEKTISIKSLRKDAEIMEQAHINPNLPEVLFAQDVREFITKARIKVKVMIDSKWGNLNSINGHKELKEEVDKIFSEEFGDDLISTKNEMENKQ